MRFSVEPHDDARRQAWIKITKQGEPHPDMEDLQKNPPTVHEMMNDLGEAGWELVAVDQSNNYVFKRPKA